MNIGEKIKEGRQKQRLSKKELSRLLGVSREIIWYWETNRSTPSGETLLKLMKLLKLTPKEIMDDCPCQKP